jgi:uncharacterized protein YcnI
MGGTQYYFFHLKLIIMNIRICTKGWYVLKKLTSIFTASLSALFLFTGIASAHVTVQPAQTTEGSYEVFTVRVPSEKDIPTTKIEIKFPNEVDVSRFEPKPGWKYDVIKDATGKITSVTWTTTGEGLTSTDFGQFNMQGRVANGSKEITWKAYQTYKDGSVVEWVGAPGSDKPASVTKVNPKPTGSPADEHTPATTAPASGTDKPSNAPLYISLAALAASLVSLVVSFKRKA